eukprot:10675503-Karenia_brevis.AAC.1
METDDEEDLAAEALLSFEHLWMKAAARRDVESMWSAWSMAAEKYLIQRSGLSQQAEMKKFTGRAKDQRPKKVHATAKQSSEQLGAQAQKQRQLQRLVRRCEELARRLALLRQSGFGCTPHDMQRLWLNIAKD